MKKEQNINNTGNLLFEWIVTFWNDLRPSWTNFTNYQCGPRPTAWEALLYSESYIWTTDIRKCRKRRMSLVWKQLRCMRHRCSTEKNSANCPMREMARLGFSITNSLNFQSLLMLWHLFAVKKFGLLMVKCVGIWKQQLSSYWRNISYIICV